MSDTSRDRQVERDRYDRRASAVISSGATANLGPEGAAGVPENLRTPYEVYEQRIAELAKATSKVLDVCCGNGQHSLTAAALGARVLVSDIAPANVTLTVQRASLRGWPIEGRVADAESQPWPDGFFDIVTCAGSLSYVDHHKFFREVRRLIRPNGWFVCVDSLNHNPIYRLNRYLHYRQGHRSLSTLERMPSLATIALMEAIIGPTKTSFHGIFTFASPLVVPLAGRRRCKRFLDQTDRAFPVLRRYAFKFVSVARRTK